MEIWRGMNMMQEQTSIDLKMQEKRRKTIAEIRKAVFDLENENVRLKTPKKDSEIVESITNLIRRKAAELEL